MQKILPEIRNIALATKLKQQKKKERKTMK